MRLAIAMGALALAGCATNAERQGGRQAAADRDLAKALEGRVAGKPQDCISASSASGPQIIDRRTILYREGQRVWVNDVGTCPGLDQGDILIVEIHGSQICRNDKFRATQPGSAVPGPYCFFGKFTPYEKAKR